MPAIQCLSCEVQNPGGAKFCQECGSALNLKLCAQCEAVNDRAAEQCHQCQAPLGTVSALKAPASLRNRRARASLVAGALIVLAGLAYYSIYERPPLPAKILAKEPVATAVAPPAAPQVAAEPAKPKGASPSLPPPAPRAASVRAITHTPGTQRPASIAPAPSASAPANPGAPVPAAGTEAPPPVTHTKRAAIAPKESN